ncbi:MAG: hypothetical protein FJ280_26840 [Planctomycetes bacterium]|nr:hypothetical protein [Planctomycetota bacterium]
MKIKSSKPTETAEPPQRTPAEVDADILAFSHSIDKVRHELDAQVRIIRDCVRRSTQAQEDFHRAVAEADEPAEQKARGIIAAAKAERTAAQATLRSLRPKLVAFEERREVLRLAAIDLIQQAHPRFEEARRELSTCQVRHDHVNRLREPIRDIQLELDRESPQPAAEQKPVGEAPQMPTCPHCCIPGHVEKLGGSEYRCSSPAHNPIRFNWQPKPAESSALPKCPRCLTRHTASAIGGGRFRCDAPHHGVIVYDSDGKICQQGFDTLRERGSTMKRT